MSQTEADRVINEVITKLTASFEPRFDGIDKRLESVETDVKELKRRMVSVEDRMDDILIEQRLLRHTMVSNLDDIMRLKLRLDPQPL